MKCKCAVKFVLMFSPHSLILGLPEIASITSTNFMTFTYNFYYGHHWAEKSWMQNKRMRRLWTSFQIKWKHKPKLGSEMEIMRCRVRSRATLKYYNVNDAFAFIINEFIFISLCYDDRKVVFRLKYAINVRSKVRLNHVQQFPKSINIFFSLLVDQF